MLLRTEKIVKKYRKRTVVKEVSVEVRQGEIVGLLGPNGAGKTTSFYIIVGLIKALLRGCISGRPQYYKRTDVPPGAAWDRLPGPGTFCFS